MLETAMLELNAQDRCDRCGARATSMVRLRTGGALLFCLHHHNQFWPSLSEQEAEIVAFSTWLN